MQFQLNRNLDCCVFYQVTDPLPFKYVTSVVRLILRYLIYITELYVEMDVRVRVPCTI